MVIFSTSKTKHKEQEQDQMMLRGFCCLFTAILVSFVITVQSFTFLGNLKVPQLNEIQSKFNAEKKFGNKKIVVITGTSSGLGKHTTLQLLRDGGFHVIGAVRDMEKMKGSNYNSIFYF